MTGIMEPGINGFMLGIATGPFCAVTCLPMLISIAMARGEAITSRGTWTFLGVFLAGRFVAYLAFGLVMALVSTRLGMVGHRVGIYAEIALSIALVAYGLGVPFPHFGLCRIAGRTSRGMVFPFVLGGLTGLNVCPPFLLAVSYLLQRQISPAFGAFFFVSFYVASSLFVLPAGLAGLLPGRVMIARFGRAAVIVVGVVFFWRGMSALTLG